MRITRCFFLPAIALLAWPMHAEQPPAVPGPFLHEAAVSWKVNEFEIARWKTLVGGIEGGQIAQEDVQFGLWELAPNAVYHGHKHAVPEIYFILSGKAEWTVGDEARKVGAGTTIYTQPGAVHRMANLTGEPVRAIWVWWAPNGEREVFAGAYEFTEEAPRQPADAKFGDDAAQRLH